MVEREYLDRHVEPTPDRPAMPVGYGVDRSPTGGMISWGDVRARLAGARNYWIVTTRADGRPHAAPVWGIWLDETFYFSTDRASRKARNLDASPELVVHLESGDDVVILEGRAEELADPSVRTRFADAYETKYAFRPDTGEGALIYGVRPRITFAWLERDFPNSATRWRFG